MNRWPGDKIYEYKLPQYCQGQQCSSSYTNVLDISLAYIMLYATFSVLPALTGQEQEWLWAYVERLNTFMTDYTLAACLGEVRHLFSSTASRCYYPYLYENAIHPLFKEKGSRGKTRSGASRDLWEKLIISDKYSKAAVFDLCEQAYIHRVWKFNFGGPKWGFISRVGKDLAEADTRVKQLLALDKLAHLAHTGALFLATSKFSWAFCSYCPERLMEFKRHAYSCCWWGYESWRLIFRSFLPESIVEHLSTQPPAHHYHSSITGSSYVDYPAQREYLKQVTKKRKELKDAYVRKLAKKSQSIPYAPSYLGTQFNDGALPV